MKDKKWKKILIIAGGKIPPDVDVVDYLDDETFVMAVNGGMTNASKLGISPDCILGDLDSLPETFKLNPDTQIKTFPPEKDKSDLELALDEATLMNPEKIYVIGAIGDRTDHTLFNIFLLIKYKEFPIIINNGKEEIYLAGKISEISAPLGSIVSLVPLTSSVEGITTSGLYYPLNNECLFMGSSRGLSNLITGSPASIRFDSGELLLIVMIAPSPVRKCGQGLSD